MVWRVLLLSVTFVLALTACGGGAAVSTAADPPPEKVLSHAADALKGVKAFHFKLEHENGSTEIPLNLKLTGAEGDAVPPDRLSADVKAKAGNAAVGVKVIGIGQDTWITNPFTRQWQHIGAVSIRDIADPANVVGDVVGSLKKTAVAGHDSVDGVDTYRITGEVDSGALASAFSAAEPGLKLGVEVWIGVNDSLPRRVRLTGPITKDEAQNIVRVVTLSKFNQPVSIQPPK